MWGLWSMVKFLQIFCLNSQGEKVEWFHICHKCSTFSSQETTAIVPLIALAFWCFLLLFSPASPMPTLRSSAVLCWYPPELYCVHSTLNSSEPNHRAWSRQHSDISEGRVSFMCPLPRRGELFLCVLKEMAWQGDRIVQWCCKYSEVSMKKVALSALYSWNSNGIS